MCWLQATALRRPVRGVFLRYSGQQQIKARLGHSYCNEKKYQPDKCASNSPFTAHSLLTAIARVPHRFLLFFSFCFNLVLFLFALCSCSFLYTVLPYVFNPFFPPSFCLSFLLPFAPSFHLWQKCTTCCSQIGITIIQPKSRCSIFLLSHLVLSFFSTLTFVFGKVYDVLFANPDSGSPAFRAAIAAYVVLLSLLLLLPLLLLLLRLLLLLLLLAKVFARESRKSCLVWLVYALFGWNSSAPSCLSRLQMKVCEWKIFIMSWK